MSKDSVKTQIDTDITNKTTSKSISPLNVGGNIKAVVDLIPDKSYKIYNTLLSCTDSVTPVLTILENTIGNIICTRNSAGNYSATLLDAFTIGKTIGFSSINNGYIASVSFSIGSTNDVVFIQTFSTVTGNPIDYIENLAIEIRVYN